MSGAFVLAALAVCGGTILLATLALSAAFRAADRHVEQAVARALDEADQ